MDSIVEDRDKITVIFTHGGTLHHIVAWWLGLEPEHMTRAAFGAAPTGITVLTKSSFNERTIDRLNDTSHLVGLGYWYPLPKS